MFARRLKRSLLGAGCAATAALALTTCVTRPVGKASPGLTEEGEEAFQQSLQKDVDILFVIDTSQSMRDDQQNLKQNFDKLIDGLRMVDLGATGPEATCTPEDRSGCKIPNVRIGVVTTDLGIMVPADTEGAFVQATSCARPNGDDALLQPAAGDPGCLAPPAERRFIEYSVDAEGKVSTPGLSGGPSDPIERVKEAFRCIAAVGNAGCGFEQQLEAARRALDPDSRKNLGFLRDDALLAVVWITDEDDCSHRDPELWRTTRDELVQGEAAVNSPRGYPGNFRCFEFGIRCDDNSRELGRRENCRPYEASEPVLAPTHLEEKPFETTPLYPPSEYVNFFKSLKPGRNVILAAIAGPTLDPYIEPISAINPNPEPAKSCEVSYDDPVSGATITTSATPALRIKAVIDRMDEDGQFSTICSADFGPALSQLANKITAKLEAQCMRQPVLNKDGAVVCQEGDTVALDAAGAPIPCPGSCLEEAACNVDEEVTASGEAPTKVQKCKTELWYPEDWENDRACDPCPCWRLVAKPPVSGASGSCDPTQGVTPYALDIVRGPNVEARRGTVASINCATTSLPWGSAELNALPICGSSTP